MSYFMRPKAVAVLTVVLVLINVLSLVSLQAHPHGKCDTAVKQCNCEGSDEGEDVTHKTAFSDNVRFHFFAGLEGTGHHFWAHLLRNLQFSGVLRHEGLSLKLFDVDGPGSVFWRPRASSEAAFVQELRKTVEAAPSNRSVHFALNINGDEHARDGQMSYPNFFGVARAAQHPDLALLAVLAEEARADLRITVLLRDPAACVNSGLKNNYGMFEELTSTYILMATALHDQLARVDCAFLTCTDLSSDLPCHTAVASHLFGGPQDKYSFRFNMERGRDGHKAWELFTHEAFPLLRRLYKAQNKIVQLCQRCHALKAEPMRTTLIECLNESFVKTSALGDGGSRVEQWWTWPAAAMQATTHSVVVVLEVTGASPLSAALAAVDLLSTEEGTRMFIIVGPRQSMSHEMKTIAYTVPHQDITSSDGSVEIWKTQRTDVFVLPSETLPVVETRFTKATALLHLPPHARHVVYLSTAGIVCPGIDDAVRVLCAGMEGSTVFFGGVASSLTAALPLQMGVTASTPLPRKEIFAVKLSHAGRDFLRRYYTASLHLNSTTFRDTHKNTSMDIWARWRGEPFDIDAVDHEEYALQKAVSGVVTLYGDQFWSDTIVCSALRCETGCAIAIKGG